MKENIAEKNKYIKSLETEAKKLYEEKTPEELAADAKLDFTSAAFNEYNSEILKSAYTQEALRQRQKELKDYISPEWQAKKTAERKKKIQDEIESELNAASTPEEVQNVVDQTEDTEFEGTTISTIADQANEEENTKSEFIDRYAGNPMLFMQEKNQLSRMLSEIFQDAEIDEQIRNTGLAITKRLEEARNVRDFEAIINEIKTNPNPIIQDVGKLIDLYYEEKNKAIQDKKDITPTEEKTEDEPSSPPVDSKKDLEDTQSDSENQDEDTGNIVEDEGKRTFKTAITNIAYLANKFETYTSEAGEKFIRTSIDPKTGKIAQEVDNERRVSIPEFMTPGSNIIMFVDPKASDYNDTQEDFTKVPIAIQSEDDFNKGLKPKLWLHRLDWITEAHVAEEEVERIYEETKAIRAKLFNFQHGIPFSNKISWNSENDFRST